MKKLYIILLGLATVPGYSQTAASYFEKIRSNEAELTAFLSQMPKGGDLHHHYTGSVYAETYIAYVVSHNYWINKKTLEVADKKPNADNSWTTFSSLQNDGQLSMYKDKLFRKWSVKDYNEVDYPSDKLFFETFGNFSIAAKAGLDNGLLELKKRALAEHVSYIETMFVTIDSRKIDLSAYTSMNESLRKASSNEKNIVKALDSLYTAIQSKGAAACAKAFNDTILAKHTRLKIDDAGFTMRYMNYVTRVMEPVDVFRAMVVAFESADASSLVVGVNIVAPEDNETAMNDYMLHMQMFNYCHAHYPAVKISLHAGELTLGVVKPEDLTWHINAAVYTGNAMRIGHGVDMAYEKNCYDLLNYMRDHNIAVEINLFSNEFILKVKDDRHPFALYKDFKVPIVISTDDAGVLRSNLIHQYVLLAKRYKNVSYSDIKTYVYNSIEYSFIEEPAVKEALKASLDLEFKLFEEKIIALEQ
ncbi:MAG: adenosine deaminase [Bacteroidetes bacterium]|nr:adenosine deaminase [Bacteroidota bacterium]